MEKYDTNKTNVVNAKLSPFLFYVFILFVSVLFVSGRAFGATYYATADTHVNQGSPTTNYGSWDAAYAGANGDNEYWALFKWDLSSLTNVTITSAIARFYCSDYLGNLMTPEVYKVTSSWNEGSVTWNTKPSYGGSDIGHDDLDSSGWFEVDASALITIVQGWVDSSSTNYGLVIRHDAYGDLRLAEFRTKEYSGGTYKAQLIVTYTVADTEGPYAPGNIRMSQSHDTAGESDSDGITYIGNPQFEWTKPSDRGTSGTKDYYQWAVTAPSDNPWDGPRIAEGFTSNTYVQPGTLSDGNYKFWVQAQDNADNWGDWGSTSFTIDTTSPPAASSLTNPSSPTDDTTPQVSWSQSPDSGSGIWTYDVSFYDGPGSDRLYQSGDQTLDDVDYVGDSLEDGTWKWKVHTIDVAGNDEWSTFETIIIGDGNGPVISGWIVTDDGSGNVTIQLDASDESGVNNIDIEYSIGSPIYDRTHWLNYVSGTTWQNTLPDTFSNGDQVYIKAIAYDGSPSSNSTEQAYPSNPHSVAVGPLSININVADTEQTIEGFGGSLAFYDNWLVAHPNKNTIYDLIFHQLGTSILRIRNQFEINDNSSLSIQSEIVAEASNSLGYTPKILLCSWSPPTELKSNGLITNGTLKKDGNGDYMYSAFADWWNDSLSAYNSNSIFLEYISIQNEPDFTNDINPSCKFTPSETSEYAGYGLALSEVASIIDSSIKIISPETAGFSEISNYLTSAELDLSDLYGYAHHMYAANNVSRFDNPGSFIQEMLDLNAAYNDKPKFQTEYCRLSSDNGLDEAINLAQHIHNSLTYEKTSAYLTWGLIWENKFEAGGEGLVLLDNPWESSPGYVINKKYYAFKHFSKYVRPDYWRLDLSTQDASPLLVSAYKSPSEQIVVVLIINPESYEIDVSVSGLESYDLCQALITDNDSNCAEIVWNETAYSRSITTLVFDVNLLSPDIDDDNDVDFVDFAQLASHYLDTGCRCPKWCESADLDKSGSVDFGDLKILCQHWLEGTTP